MGRFSDSDILHYVKLRTLTSFSITDGMSWYVRDWRLQSSLSLFHCLYYNFFLRRLLLQSPSPGTLIEFIFISQLNYFIQKNSMAWVRERTIPTEPLPLVGEVSANFCGERLPRGQRNGSLRPYSRFLERSRSFLFQVVPQLYSRGWKDPVPDLLLLRKCDRAGIEPGPLNL
jgi:hypothetical protein